jgi:hypothetical protein
MGAELGGRKKEGSKGEKVSGTRVGEVMGLVWVELHKVSLRAPLLGSVAAGADVVPFPSLLGMLNCQDGIYTVQLDQCRAIDDELPLGAGRTSGGCSCQQISSP